MKYQITFVFLFILSTFCFAQAPMDITGNWIVEEVSLADDLKLEGADLQKMNAFKAEFVASTFSFFADEKANFTSSLPDLQIEGGHWKYYDKGKMIAITDWKDRSKTLMGIFVKELPGGELQFFMQETPLVLRMRKI